ncbi:hypothetical protein GTP55_13535 [Duganella sp. FT109W]|uniref:Phage shock protein PspC N-terminal domain-containing protein n=1 Tax=Duganella margarita TaxID=2692170 RepID=A0ABW9WGX6_9BURK|nr:hypothetical protein [Duganella margarita]MYN40396.1 hypothetical protein [Duganella margarita]
MKRVHSGSTNLLAEAMRWISLALTIRAAAWLGARIIHACLRLALAMFGLLAVSFLLYGLGYVIFYPVITR